MRVVVAEQMPGPRDLNMEPAWWERHDGDGELPVVAEEPRLVMLDIDGPRVDVPDVEDVVIEHVADGVGDLTAPCQSPQIVQMRYEPCFCILHSAHLPYLAQTPAIRVRENCACDTKLVRLCDNPPGWVRTGFGIRLKHFPTTGAID